MLIMRRQAGVTLIETVIAIAIMVILIALGLPSYSTYIANTKIRSSAEAFLAGLQTARTEAVKRNTGVEFLLTNSDPVDGNKATATASATGSNWMVRTSDLGTFIDGRTGGEGGGGNSAQVSGGTVGSIVFNGFGATNLVSAATFHFTNPAGGACETGGGPMRCLDVVVSIGGQARMCDPKITTTTDTRKC